MNEVINLLKKYPQFILGIFIIYSISYNKSDNFFWNTIITFLIIYFISYTLIEKLAFWAYIKIDDECNISEMLFPAAIIGVFGYICFIFYKIFLSPIWDIILSKNTYAEKIKFILNDNKLCLLAALILLFRLLWLSAGRAQKIENERFKKKINNTK